MSTLRGPALVVAALSSGCGIFTDPSRGVPVQFSAVYQPGSNQVPSVSIAAAGSVVLVVGGLIVGDPCHTLSATATVSGGDVVIQVRASRTPGNTACFAVLATFSYSAAIGTLTPGNYRVVVKHALGAQVSRAAEAAVRVGT